MIKIFKLCIRNSDNFSKGICLKVNIIARVECELAYSDVAVLHINHDFRGTFKCPEFVENTSQDYCLVPIWLLLFSEISDKMKAAKFESCYELLIWPGWVTSANGL